jgi:hypothetical protein
MRSAIRVNPGIVSDGPRTPVAALDHSEKEPAHVSRHMVSGHKKDVAAFKKVDERWSSASLPHGWFPTTRAGIADGDESKHKTEPREWQTI